MKYYTVTLKDSDNNAIQVVITQDVFSILGEGILETLLKEGYIEMHRKNNKNSKMVLATVPYPKIRKRIRKVKRKNGKKK